MSKVIRRVGVEKNWSRKGSLLEPGSLKGWYSALEEGYSIVCMLVLGCLLFVDVCLLFILRYLLLVVSFKWCVCVGVVVC
mmetsp:Transcript_37049/g.58300  ORF Transcript_37049/g.58300 Transcript_37049/m.58300 type:complete len:80 (-) Transcript_37049:17-256(-)